MKIDPERVGKAWNERVSKTVLSSWRYLAGDMRKMILDVIEACHEPVELTEEEVGHVYDGNIPSRYQRWSELSPLQQREQTQYANTLRRYTPPSLPTKLARAIEALGDDHPEAVRILKEAADADG